MELENPNSKRLTPLETPYNKNDIFMAVNKETGEVTEGLRFIKGYKEGFTFIASYNITETPFLWRNDNYDLIFEKSGEPDPPLIHNVGDLFREKFTGDIIEIHSKNAGKYQWKYPGKKYEGEMSLSQRGMDELFEPVLKSELSNRHTKEYHKQKMKTMEKEKAKINERLEDFNKVLSRLTAKAPEKEKEKTGIKRSIEDFGRPLREIQNSKEDKNINLGEDYEQSIEL